MIRPAIRLHAGEAAADFVERPALPRDCTFDPADWYLLARCWFPVSAIEEVTATPLACTLLDVPLVLYRVDDTVVVAHDACPHRGVPLSRAHPDPHGIRCAYHGLLFGKDGTCLDIPSAPCRAITPRLHLATLPAVERHGLVWTCLWPTAGAEPRIPPMPYETEPGFQRALCPRYPIACFAGRQIEGFLDVAHFPWVHSRTFADADDREVPNYTTRATGDGFVADYYSQMANYPVDAGLKAPEGFIWHRHFEVHLPFSASLVVHFPAGRRLVIMNLASPASACRTHLFVPVAKDFDIDRPVEEMLAFNRRIFDEDKPLAEAQRPRNLPLAPGAEPHIPADRSSIAYRQALARQGYGRFFDG